METPISMLLLMIAAGIIIGASLPDHGDSVSDDLISIRATQALSILGCIVDYEIEGIPLTRMILDGSHLPLKCSGNKDNVTFSSYPGEVEPHLSSILEMSPDGLNCLIRFSLEGSPPLRIDIPHIQQEAFTGDMRIEVCLPIHRDDQGVMF